MFFLTACKGEFYPPDYVYYADFDSKHIGDIEVYARELAKKRGYRVFEKNKDQMTAITRGQEAFFIAYYNDRELPIFSISNAGAGTILSVMISVNDKFTIEEASELALEVKNDLKEKFNINLQDNS